MANLDYWNRDAVVEMGFFDKYDTEHGEDKGWALSVIDSMSNDALSDNGLDESDYSADENAVWDWYYDTFGGDKWDGVVEQWRADQGEENITPGDPTDFELQTDETDETIWSADDHGIDKGNFSGDVSGNNEMVVSTEAIQHLIDAFKQVATGEHAGVLIDLANSLERTDATKLKPGGFARAELLRQKIDGTSADATGVRGETIKMLENMHRALYDVQVGLALMKTEYQNAEDDATVTGEKLQEHMKSAWESITALNGGPSTIS